MLFSRSRLSDVRHVEACAERQPATVGTLSSRSGVVSDQRFSEYLIVAKQKRFGHRKIAHELKAKGLDAKSIEQVMLISRGQKLDAARGLAKKISATARKLYRES